MIHHHQQALTAKPVGIDNVAAVDSAHRFALIRCDQPATPANIRIASRAVSVFQRAHHWHDQCALSVCEGHSRFGWGSRSDCLQLTEQGVQARLVALQHVQALLIVLHLLADLGKGRLSRCPLVCERFFCRFGRARLFPQCGLGLGDAATVLCDGFQTQSVVPNHLLLRFDQRLKVGEVAGNVLRVLVAEPDPEAASLLQKPQLLNGGVDGIGSLALGLAELFAFRIERTEFLLKRATFLTQRTELSVQFADLNLCLSQCILQRVAFIFLRRQPCLNDGDLCA